MSKTYAEKLRDPRWQRKRLEILERDKWVCTNCGDTEQELHVHHRRYEVGKEPWEYDDSVLTTLCADCHEATTAQLRQLRDMLGNLRSGGLDCVFGFAMATWLRSTGVGSWPDTLEFLNYDMAFGFLAAFGLLPEQTLVSNWDGATVALKDVREWAQREFAKKGTVV